MSVKRFLLFFLLHVMAFVLGSVSVFAENSGMVSEKQTFIGQKACAECHQKQSVQWSGSHHDQAMQAASVDTVLGNFNQVDFRHRGITSTFYRTFYLKDNQYWIKTDGPDGELQDFQIEFTFGVYPLQQYLVKLANGHLQVLDIAWDSRDAGQGGQRWYALHSGEAIEHNDTRHWTGPGQNWNSQCAECHSTNLQKNYDSETGNYQTQWSEIDVSCEACHGPGLEHQQWAKSVTEQSENKTYIETVNKGLSVTLNETKGVTWTISSENNKPLRSRPRLRQTEIDTCARCHSRRTQFSQTGDKSNEQFLDNFHPSLLTEPLYHADGQMQEEVYVYGSFLQSKMYQAGVTCSDCHEPHLAELKLPGDRVCNQCHQSEQYRTQKHHFHPASANTSCLDCHMPVKTFMGVDQRHDHRFSMPRPDLSQSLKTPDACLVCHIEQSSQWSAEQLNNWYGDKQSGLRQFAAILDAQRKQLPHSNQQAIKILQDHSEPVIARATILSQISGVTNDEELRAIKEQLQHEDAMLRVAALMSLATLTESEALAFESAAEIVFPILDDPVRLVRMEAAQLLAPLDETQLQAEDRIKLQKARQEYIDSQLFNADRPESQVNLGQYYFQNQDYQNAEKAYRKALALQSQFVPAWVNLAQFYSEMNRDKDALQTLQRGLEQVPEAQSADIYYSMGLAQVREKDISEALVSLQRSALLAPENPHYSYVYGIALNSYQRPDEALDVLQKAHDRHPQNYEILMAMVRIYRETGNNQAALKYAQKISLIMPEDQQIQQLVEQLEALLQ